MIAHMQSPPYSRSPRLSAEEAHGRPVAAGAAGRFFLQPSRFIIQRSNGGEAPWQPRRKQADEQTHGRAFVRRLGIWRGAPSSSCRRCCSAPAAADCAPVGHRLLPSTWRTCQRRDARRRCRLRLLEVHPRLACRPRGDGPSRRGRPSGRPEQQPGADAGRRARRRRPPRTGHVDGRRGAPSDLAIRPSVRDATASPSDRSLRVNRACR
jgi:hypothetical protein